MIAIEGAGPVGMACALFLRRLGVDSRRIGIALDAAVMPPALAKRTLALGLGSWQLLSRVIALPVAAPIQQVEVSMNGRLGRTRIDAADMKQQALGYVLEYQALQRALNEAAVAAGLGASPSIPDASAQACAAAPLLRINAQGDTGADADERDFNQSALLANLACPHLTGGVACERFTREGPLALLPLPAAGRFALVWCGPPETTAARAAMSEERFVADLIERAGPRLTGATLVSPRVQAPLLRRRRDALVDGDQVWIGNAAQALHPVAGQGLNLGLRDAFELARAIAPLFTRDAAPEPVQLRQALARFAQDRASDRKRTISITDTLASVFSVRALRPFESIALAALDLSGVPRRALAATLMYGNR